MTDFGEGERSLGKVIELNMEKLHQSGATMDNIENQNTYKVVIDSNPSKIEGSVGSYLLALRPGMTLSQAEKEQERIESAKKIDDFGIIDDDGKIYSAKSKGEKIDLLWVKSFEVSNEFVNAKKLDFKLLPESHRQLLNQKNITVEFHKDIYSYDRMHGTKYATEPVDGYDLGYTGANVDVFFDKDRKIIVSFEYFKSFELNRVIPTAYVSNPTARFIHEFGHAYSMARNFDVELNPQIMQTFESIRRNVLNSPVTNKALKYFSQYPITNSHGKIVEHPGLRETMAEIYASHFGGSSQSQHVQKSLLEVYKPIEEIMTENGYFK